MVVLLSLTAVLIYLDLHFPLIGGLGQVHVDILNLFRIPRVVTAVLVGVGISLAGLNMQVQFRNALAGPSILGVNTGATIAVALFLLGTSGTTLVRSVVWMDIGGFVTMFAIMGAFAILMLIGALSYLFRSNFALLIVGILISYFGIAIVSIMQFFAAPEALQTFIFWTFGSVEALTYNQIGLLAATVLVGISLVVLIIGRLNSYLLGDEYAISMGTDVKKVRILLMASTGLISGVVTALCGPIGFVGLAVPHLARLIFRVGDLKTLMIGTLILGADLMLLADMLSHTHSSVVLPINAVTALLGSPVIVYFLFKQRKKNWMI